MSVGREQCDFVGLELVLAGFKRHLAFNEPEVALEIGPARSKFGVGGWLLSGADALLVPFDLLLECLELGMFYLGLSLELIAKSIHFERAPLAGEQDESVLGVGKLGTRKLEARLDEVRLARRVCRRDGLHRDRGARLRVRGCGRCGCGFFPRRCRRLRRCRGLLVRSSFARERETSGHQDRHERGGHHHGRPSRHWRAVRRAAVR